MRARGESKFFARCAHSAVERRWTLAARARTAILIERERAAAAARNERVVCGAALPILYSSSAALTCMSAGLG